MMPLSDEAVLAALPGVPISRDNVEHYRGLLDRRLLINRCSDCGYWIYPHRPLCPQCLSWNVSATEVSGEARIFMFTLIHQERDPQGRLLEPLPVAAIELNEQPGLRYLATIVNCPTDQIAVDMPVRLVWTERDGLAWPAFEPADRR
jgi:uncharacterized OB-fold protein